MFSDPKDFNFKILDLIKFYRKAFLEIELEAGDLILAATKWDLNLKRKINILCQKGYEIKKIIEDNKNLLDRNYEYCYTEVDDILKDINELCIDGHKSGVT